MIFVDTNYFLRFLLKDVSSQHQKAKQLFRQAAEGKVKLFTDLVVFFEIFWVFTSYYQKPKQEVIEILKDILTLSFISFEERGLAIDALDVYAQSGLELEDCYHLVYLKEKGGKKLASFDKKLQRELGSKY